MVLYLIGLGLGGVEDVTVRGLNAIRRCSRVYLEAYTSILCYGLETSKLEQFYGKAVTTMDREFVEQNGVDGIMDDARGTDIAFLVVGDPFGATTHIDLVLRAKKAGVDVQVIHNASIMNAVGCCGLQLYSFGETVSIVMWTEDWRPDSYYDKIFANRRRGLHTLCLLDIKIKEQSVEDLMRGRKVYAPAHYMTCAEAATQLLEISQERCSSDPAHEPVYDANTHVVGLARVGWEDQKIIYCTLGKMASEDLGPPLHSLIIPGKVHPLEEEMLRTFKEYHRGVMAAQLKRAYVGMGCFWGVESSFAKIEGVQKTRVGYAGGTTPNPTYASIGDHTEITEIQFDDKLTSFKDILSCFFTHHDPAAPYKKQYQSAILYVDEEQQRQSEEAMVDEQRKMGRPLHTYLKPLDKFYQAEDYHQKYWLRCQHSIFKQLKLSDSEVVNSTLTAKLNAFLAGYDNFKVLKELEAEYKLAHSLVKAVEEIARKGGDPRACH